MTAALPDYYAILHVDPAAPAEVIRASYRTLMQRLRAHPDLGGDHEAASRLNVAYATLKDPGRRAEYDARRAAAGCNAGASAGARPSASPARDAANPPPQRAPEPRGDQHGATHNWQPAGASATHAKVCPFCGTVAVDGSRAADTREHCRVCTAPLAIVRAPDPDATQRQRAIYRIAKAEKMQVFCESHDRTGSAALVHDVSLSGMRFSSGAQFHPADVIRVDCDIFAAIARIAHVSRSDTGETHYGAEFLTAQFKRQRGSLLSVPA